MLWCFIFINQWKCIFTHLLIYLLGCFLAPLLLNLLTYSLSIPCIRRWCWTLTENFSATTLQKILDFIMKTYISLIFHTQININSKKYIIILILIFSQFSPMFVPENLKSTAAYVLTQLRHWFAKLINS